MCGIAGIFQYNHSDTISSNELTVMSNHMQMRGPDGAGIWINNEGFVGFAHRRLSIIDLSENANQPLHDNACSIVFNGEIYNYKKLRDGLISQGFHFQTHSDTEVLLKLYRCHGSAMLSQLRGMFAFAIWDEKNKTLFCARDHFGIKPFYFSDNGHCFQFASQVKTLLTLPGINTKPCAAGHIGFYLLGSVPEPHTLYEGIQALPAGSYLLLSQHGKKIQKTYYSIQSAFIKAENNTNNTTSLKESLYDTVRHHLIADVDVGVFLSAGIDSSTLVNVASESSTPKTMTLGFQEYRNTNNDETVFAELIAQTFHTHQKTQWLSKQSAQEQRIKIFSHMDQPSIDGINTYFVSLAAAQNGLKVALSGLGADELFAGYPHFSRTPQLLRYTKSFSRIGKSFRRYAKKLLSAKKASIFEYGHDMASLYFLTRALFMPWELDAFLDQDFINNGIKQLNLLERLKNDIAGIRTQRFQISALEIQWYMRNQLLRDSDWASMAHSLEIRVPFVDVNFFETVINLSAKKLLTKNDLACAPNRNLPNAVLHRKKTGFNIPITAWFLGSMDMKTFAKWVMTEI